ncbi:MAG: aspartate--tRNA ligase [Candidatus Omnitrophica bacterium]|nr:aspartate--tRNA ligase [Candidatus Omnitrophota bacterium]
MLRTHTCGELSEKNNGADVTLSGWVHSRRDHGELVFVDLRDAYGITQIVFDPKESRELHAQAEKLRSEFVIQVAGTVRLRPKGTENTKIPTGLIEIAARKMVILNQALTPPFEIDDTQTVSEEARLKYRYIDLRRPVMQRNLRLRHRMNKIMRDFLDEKKFVEVETPILTKSTPEGARDYLVPSRLNAGYFFALPQSPQLFKQILMVSGLDRYYQIARCFRDEDLRADRQPEFTQLDIEMSFIDEEDVFALCEELLVMLFKDLKGITLKTPFPRLPYREAMARYGSDKPDTRIPIELKDISSIVKACNFNVFKQVIGSGGSVIGLTGRGCAGFSRSKIDELTKLVQSWGAKGLAYFILEDGKVNSPIQKFFTQDELAAITGAMGAVPGDIMFFVADRKEVIYPALNALRIELARINKLIDHDKVDLLWVVDFPLFKYNEEEKRWESEHHPFTSLKTDDIPLIEKGDLGNIRSKSYDLVINGMEIASGSIRIHSKELQEKIFKTIGISGEEAAVRFGFLLDAFRYGAPPHGGIALGLDRFITIFTKSESIRDVIAFPKTQKAVCPMTSAPSTVDEKQLKELHIRTIP